MKKLNSAEIRNLLAEYDYFTLRELDNIMMENGYYSVADDGCYQDCIDSLNIVYTAMNTNECEIQIFFNDIEETEEDEGLDQTIISNWTVEEFL